eukprot:g19040.t1
MRTPLRNYLRLDLSLTHLGSQSTCWRRHPHRCVNFIKTKSIKGKCERKCAHSLQSKMGAVLLLSDRSSVLNPIVSTMLLILYVGSIVTLTFAIVVRLSHREIIINAKVTAKTWILIRSHFLIYAQPYTKEAMGDSTQALSYRLPPLAGHVVSETISECITSAFST